MSKFTDLRGFQVSHRLWLEKNFPNQLPHQPLLGLIEEVGELSHAHLKHEQGIRGMDDEDKFRAQQADAVGDIMIYLASYCNTNGLNMAACLENAWEEVSARDWNSDPVGGVSSPLPSGEAVGSGDQSVPD